MLDLAIPVVSQSTITTPLALDLQPAIAGAGGPVVGAPNLRQYSLGPASRLVARWPVGEQAPAAAQVEVDQLTWWKLKPGSVVVRGKFRFRPIGGVLDRVTIEVDPRLRIVRKSIVPATATVEETEGPRHILTVVPGEKSESELTLTAEWLWVDASGAGNLSLPRIAGRGDRVVRSWTGISIDSTLTVADAASLTAKPITSDDFLIAWSEPDALPDLAADDLPDSVLRTITLLPAAPQPTVKTSASWSIDAEQARLVFAANLSQVPAARFRHELDLPPALKVQRVRLTAGGAAIPHRWRQRPDGSVIVTLLAAPPPEQLLEVEAAIVRARNRPRLPLPEIEVREVHAEAAQVRIYRGPQVNVQLQNAAGWDQSQDPGLGQEVPGLGRLVAALSHSSQASPPVPVVAVSPNRPQSINRLALRVENEQGQWNAEADVEYQITGGVLDLLRLEVPAEWNGPFAITPAADYRVVPLPGGSTSQLLITPLQARSDKYRLLIRGPLKSRANDPVRAPAIAVLDAVMEERIVVLATSAQGQAAVWETRGLQATPSAALRLPEGWGGQGHEYYRVVAETFAATVSSPSAAPSRPTVTLAEIEVAPQGERRLVGRATFHVEPPTAAELILEMPPLTTLIQVSQGGVHCQCRADGLRSWRIATNSLGVPTSLEVVFETALPPDAADESRFPLTAPRLKGLSVDRTLWVLSGLESLGEFGGKSSPQTVSPLTAAVIKTETLAQDLVRVAEFQSGDLPPAVLAEIFARCQQQYLAAQTRAQARRGPIAAGHGRAAGSLERCHAGGDECQPAAGASGH